MTDVTRPMTAEEIAAVREECRFASSICADDVECLLATIDARDACIAELTARAEEAEAALMQAFKDDGLAQERELRLARERDRLWEALQKIAMFDDTYANARLRNTGSYSEFDEPSSVRVARAALSQGGDQ